MENGRPKWVDSSVVTPVNGKEALTYVYGRGSIIEEICIYIYICMGVNQIQINSF